MKIYEHEINNCPIFKADNHGVFYSLRLCISRHCKKKETWVRSYEIRVGGVLSTRDLWDVVT